MSRRASDAKVLCKLDVALWRTVVTITKVIDLENYIQKKTATLPVHLYRLLLHMSTLAWCEPGVFYRSVTPHQLRSVPVENTEQVMWVHK
jgi:hypothetical protein